MKILDYIMDEIYDEMPDMDFSSIIRESRDRLGLMQYRTAEFLGNEAWYGSRISRLVIFGKCQKKKR